MSNHRTYVAGSDGAYQGKCSCKQRGPVVAQRWEADDWVASHLHQVDRARAHLGAYHPGLVDQRNYYRKMSQDMTRPEREREQWATLADGLDHRIGRPANDEPLF